MKQRTHPGFVGATRALFLWSALWVLAAPVLAHGQTVVPGSDDPGPASPGAELDVAEATEIRFTADFVDYDNGADTVSARGNVLMQRDGIRLKADTISWNRKTGRVEALGKVAITNPEGDIAFADSMELTDTLRAGVIENLLIVMDNGARMASHQGERLDNGNIVLEQGVYSPYPVDQFTENGVYSPNWQIRATRIVYDRAHDRVRYSGARLDLFGLATIPMPGLSHQASSAGASGLLVPQVRLDRTNGIEIAVPYLLRLAPNRDLTVTPHLYSDAAPMLSTEYRALTGRGAYRINSYLTHGSVVPVTGVPVNQSDRFRGYLEGVAKFQLDPRWSIEGSGRIATDRTFLRRYDISRDDRLRSVVTAQRNGGSSFLSISGWAVQTLRVNDAQGTQAVALPVIDFRQRLDDPLLGGQVELQINSLAIGRTNGQDTQRAFAGAQWDLRRLTPWGQQVTLTMLARGDLYHSSENLLTPVVEYQGRGGLQARAIGLAAADMQWPLIGTFLDGSVQVTPRVQVVVAPRVRNVAIPNEDSRAFDLEDGNIFSFNRYSGYDRIDDSTRVTYGTDWAFRRSGLRVEGNIAQSYRLTDRPQLFPDGTGLTGRTSDIVGRTAIAWRDGLRLTHRFRLDKNNLAIRRNEFDATIGSRSTYATLGYLRLNRDITAVGEDLRDREELRAGGRISFARRWSIFGSAIVDLTSVAEDPAATTDGFEPVRSRLGVAYDDGYLNIGLTWRRDFQDTGDARRGSSFQLRLQPRNLGF